MSGTSTSTVSKITQLENSAIKLAQDGPSLLSNLQAVNSPLADQLTGKSLIASKSPLVTLLASAAAYASAKYGFGWDQQFDVAVAGGALVIAGYVMRWVSTVPVTGLFKAKPVPVAVTPAATVAASVVADAAVKP